MLRSSIALLLLGTAVTASAQDPAPVYQKKSPFGFHLEGLVRQEWNGDVTFTEKNRRHFRGKPRPGRRVEVEYRAGEAPPRRAFTRNIGVGGAFIVTTEPEAAGTAVVLSLMVPTAAHPIQVKAEVRWNTPGDAEDPAGFGVKFYGLEVEELLQLNEYFASLTGRDDDVA